MMALSLHAGMARDAASPNGKITASLKDGGLVVSYQRQTVLELPAIGIGGQTLTSGAQLKHTARISALTPPVTKPDRWLWLICDVLPCQALPELADRFLVGDAIVRVVLLCFLHRTEKVHAQVAVEVVILD